MKTLIVGAIIAFLVAFVAIPHFVQAQEADCELRTLELSAELSAIRVEYTKLVHENNLFENYANWVKGISLSGPQKEAKAARDALITYKAEKKAKEEKAKS